MTVEERIAQLEAEVRSLRLIAEGQAVALRAANLRLQQEGEATRALADRREAARLKKQRQRALRGHGVGDGLSRDHGPTVSPGLERDNGGTPPPSFPSSFPPSSTPSSSYPLSFPPSPSASQGTASPSREPESFALQPTATAKSRKPSEAQVVYENLQAQRHARCEEVGEPFVPDRWPVARQNSALGPLVRAGDGERQRFKEAWGLYLADDGAREKKPAWSLGWFMASGVRARYETEAARAQNEGEAA